jgi:DNA-binding transcriptional regulator YiaG
VQRQNGLGSSAWYSDARFTVLVTEWHPAHVRTVFRELRLSLGLNQRAFAARLGVSLVSLRMWDSGVRPVPAPILTKARAELVRHGREQELLSFRCLADEFKIHRQTLQRAVRHGRLTATLSTRSAFGRPIYQATRAAVASFIRNHSSSSDQSAAPQPIMPMVPNDFDVQLRTVRQRAGLTQAEFASRIGAARKAVVYQWESRKRKPSPVFWERVQRLFPTR